MRQARNVIIQQASGYPHEELLELTRPIHKAYCREHGFDYWSMFGDVVPGRTPHWNKFPYIQSAMEQGRNHIIWLDADCLIVDHSVNLLDGIPKNGCIGMVVHRRFEPVHFNSGAIYIESRWESYQFFKAVWDGYDPINAFPWKDQGHWHDQQVFMRFNDSISMIQEIEDRWNSTWNFNPSENPVVVAFHGEATMDRVGLMKQAIAKWHGSPKTESV